MISIAIPTRARLESVSQTVASVLTTAARPQEVEIILGADEDDPVAAALRERFGADAPAGGKVRVIVQPRFPTLGALINSLLAQASGDIICAAPDDIRFATQGWDDITRLHVRDGLITSPEVGVVPRGLVPVPFLSRSTVSELSAAQGFIVPPYFPFWFGDVWLADIGDLTGRRRELPWRIDMPEGHSDVTGARDIGFWASLYVALAPTRAKIAMKLLGLAETSLAGGIVLANARKLCARVAPMLTAETQAHWERRATQPNPRYLEAKAVAEKMFADLKQD